MPLHYAPDFSPKHNAKLNKKFGTLYFFRIYFLRMLREKRQMREFVTVKHLSERHQARHQNCRQVLSVMPLTFSPPATTLSRPDISYRQEASFRSCSMSPPNVRNRQCGNAVQYTSGGYG